VLGVLISPVFKALASFCLLILLADITGYRCWSTLLVNLGDGSNCVPPCGAVCRCARKYGAAQDLQI
jgi:hypothetical protein